MEDRRNFLTEISLMKSIGKHLNIVSMLGCVTSSGPLCLITEYCPHGDLRNYLRLIRDKVGDCVTLNWVLLWLLWYCFWRSVISLGDSNHTLFRSETKFRPILTWSLMFPALDVAYLFMRFHWLFLKICLCSDWPTWLLCFYGDTQFKRDLMILSRAGRTETNSF